MATGESFGTTVKFSKPKPTEAFKEAFNTFDNDKSQTTYGGKNHE